MAEKNYTQISILDLDSKEEMVAVSVGYYFGIVPKSATTHIDMNKRMDIEFNGNHYELYRANSYEESRKIDLLLDQYGHFENEEYKKVEYVDPKTEYINKNRELRKRYSDPFVDHAAINEEIYEMLQKDPTSIEARTFDLFNSEFSDLKDLLIERMSEDGYEKSYNSYLEKEQKYSLDDVNKMLKSIETTQDFFETLCELQGYDGASSPVFDFGDYDKVLGFSGNQFVPVTREGTDTNIVPFKADYRSGTVFDLNLAFIDENGKVWTNQLLLTLNQSFCFGGYPRSYRKTSLSSAKIGEWKQEKGFCNTKNCAVLNDKYEIDKFIYRKSPYTQKWLKSIYCPDHSIFVQAPQLEQLYKADYAFAVKIVNDGGFEPEVRGYRWYRNTADVDQKIKAFNMLCKNGTNFKTIFNTDKCVYTTLKDDSNLLVWNRYRLLHKQGKIDQSIIGQVYAANYTSDQLKQMSTLLNKEFNGKKLFSWKSLMNYLERIDAYQAITFDEAIPLLNDTIRMSVELGVEPNIDSDSLKREHDVIARTYRHNADKLFREKMSKGVERAGKELSKYNYSDGIFLVRSLNSYDDLLDEAKQQHNCVASYAGRIGKGQSKIFVMRRVSQPDVSVVTIETEDNFNGFRQRYLKFNQPVRDPEMIHFLDSWIEKAKECTEGDYNSIDEMLNGPLDQELIAIENTENSIFANGDQVIADPNSVFNNASDENGFDF